jgi:hypothetical protein
VTLVGTELDGRYLPRKRVQQTGRFELWDGWDATLRRAVSIKLADPADLGSTAQLLAGWPHPALPQLFDASPAHAARAYLVIEHLRGSTLHDRLKRRGGLDEHGALSAGRRVAELLCHLHSHGWALGGVETRGLWLFAEIDGRHVVKVADVRRAQRATSAGFAADIASLGAMLAAVGVPLAGRLSAMTAAEPSARPDAATVLRELAGPRELEPGRARRDRRLIPRLPRRRLVQAEAR